MRVLKVLYWQISFYACQNWTLQNDIFLKHASKTIVVIERYGSKMKKKTLFVVSDHNFCTKQLKHMEF